jgi:hypothetical protein
MTALLLALTLSANAQTPVNNTMARSGSVNTEHTGGPFGLGLGLGAPTGLTGKLWMGDWSALQFSVGGDIGVFNDVAAVADYVFQFRPFDTGEPDISVPLHIGAGVNVGGNLHEDITGVWRVGPRMVIGLSVMMKTLPIDIYVETAPTVYVVDSFGVSMDGQIGIRHYM